MPFKMRNLTSFLMENLCCFFTRKPQSFETRFGRVTRSKMPFEMRKLTSFPMEKLCYDLKLEVFEQMKPNDAIELAKVDAGFRSILLRKPWIVFGHHVRIIDLDIGEIKILKFSDSSFVELHTDLHLPLIKRIYACDQFWISCHHEQHEYVMLLNQLSSVKSLVIWVESGELLLKFLENFRSRVEEFASIGMEIDFLKENQVISERFENFIANQVNDCKKIQFHGYSGDLFHFYYDAFVKTSIKFLHMSAKMDYFEKIVQSIVRKRIPSKSLKAAFYVHTMYSQEMVARIVDFLSQFRGMKRLDGENQQEVIRMADDLFKKRRVYSLDYTKDFTHCLLFRRNIDSSRDCVYILDLYPSLTFLAFYVQPQSEIMLL